MKLQECLDRNKEPEAVYNQEEYLREYEYVKEKAKRLTCILRDMKFNIKSIRITFDNFIRDCRNDFIKNVSLNSYLHSDDEENSDYPFNNKEEQEKEYASIKSMLCYESGTECILNKDYNIDFPKMNNFGSYLSTERIRLTAQFYYFKLVITTDYTYYYDSENRISVKIYDIANEDLVDSIQGDEIVLWLDKDIAIYRFLKRMAECSLEDKDYSDIMTECSKYFEPSRIRVRLPQIIEFLKQKRKKCQEAKKCTESQQQ